MASNKALILLGLFVFLLVVSEVADASVSVNPENEQTVKPQGYGESKGCGRPCRHGCCLHGPHGVCLKCCSYAGEEVVQTQPLSVNPENEQTLKPPGYGESKGSGRRCRHGCCLHDSHGVCLKCCSYTGEEVVQTQPVSVNPENEQTMKLQGYGESKGSGRRCPHGCCVHGSYGICLKCCSYAREEVVQNQHVSVNPENEQNMKLEGYGESKGLGRRCRHGCCLHGHHGICLKCCSYPGEEPVETQPVYVNPENEQTMKLQGYGESKGSGRRCPHGCCLHGSHGVCLKCCSYAGEEVVQTQPVSVNLENEQNMKLQGYGESKGLGRRCRHGCCLHGPHDVCLKCCSYAGEEPVQTQLVSVNPENEQTMKLQGYGERKGSGRRCRHGCCLHDSHCVCLKCCSYAGEEVVQTQHVSVNPENEQTMKLQGYSESKRSGRRCPHGCCLHGSLGVCLKCCSYTGEEAVQTQPVSVNPENEETVKPQGYGESKDAIVPAVTAVASMVLMAA